MNRFFGGSVIQMLQAEGLRFDVTKPILERYQYRLVEDGSVSFVCQLCKHFPS